jgi:hypothetical protein
VGGGGKHWGENVVFMEEGENAQGIE